jgi:flavodoxin
MSNSKSKLGNLSKSKKVGIFCCIFMISLISTTMIIVSMAQREIITDVETINPNGTEGKAFVVYRPGLSNFQKDVTYAFINGLEEINWSIDVTTPSSQTPTDLVSYDLLVLGSVTYGNTSHDSMNDYLQRLGDLSGKKVVLIVTSGQATGGLVMLQNIVENNNGEVVESLLFHNMDVNQQDPIERSYETGKNIEEDLK